MIEYAKHYLDSGLSVLPAKRLEKRPAVGSWKAYQTRRPTPAEISAWFANAHDGLCIIAGAVSDNLEMIDFDNGGELFNAWKQQIPVELYSRLVIERSPSGGWHVVYRCQKAIDGSMKLAERKTGDKVQTLIETRGEGGLFLCAPTAGYALNQGDFTAVPLLTADEREVLLDAAYSLSEVACDPAPLPLAVRSDSSTLRPGDDYNARGDVEQLLKTHGWHYVGADDINQKWRRPGKSIGHSATLHRTERVFYPFSTNCAPFQHRIGYSPFQVYALLEHNADYSKAAADLARQGYGEKTSAHPASTDDIDLSGIVGNDEDDDEPISLTKLIANFRGLNPSIIQGLLREGETMNIIASPKVGKSWMVDLLAISLASGLEWLGFKVDSGDVLLIDNELHVNTTTWRIMQVADALKMKTPLFSSHIDVRSLRGKLKDLHRLAKTFNKIKPYQYKVIVIDAFYRTLPLGVDENDNGAIANLYNLLDLHAARLKCAFVLIHHASKGNQSSKSVTDVGAGAGSQSRAVDTHLVIRPHQDKDTFVVDAAVRSWAPIEPFVIRKQHPLFVVDPKANPEDLQGAEKKREPKSILTLEAFVNNCVGAYDPCSARLIAYHAEQQYGLSERKAKEMLELAQENKTVCKIKAGSKMQYVKYRPGFNGDKGQWVAALIANKPDMDVAEIAQKTGASERYVRLVKSGNMAEMEN